MSAWSVWCGAVEKLRPAFSRRRTFLWFLAATAAFAIREDLNGVTSFVRVLELDPGFYHSLLRMFHSTAVDVATLANLWTHAAISLLGGNLLTVRGMIVFATDGIKVAKHVTGGVLYHFWMMAMEKLGRNPKTQHLHHRSEDYRNAVRRKLRAYHCFLQAGAIAQGLMTAIGILVPEYCWSKYSSWMRTMNVSRTPSEWVVQHVLRKTFAELLADAPTSPNWVKFIRERMDLKRYRPAA